MTAVGRCELALPTRSRPLAVQGRRRLCSDCRRSQPCHYVTVSSPHQSFGCPRLSQPDGGCQVNSWHWRRSGSQWRPEGLLSAIVNRHCRPIAANRRLTVRTLNVGVRHRRLLAPSHLSAKLGSMQWDAFASHLIFIRYPVHPQWKFPPTIKQSINY